jgi:endonuclease/exonuclease/phosphatase family metal-dependent hydrolase
LLPGARLTEEAVAVLDVRTTFLPCARIVGALVLTALTGSSLAFGQTVTIRVSKDATIRGGSHANTNYGDDDILETRQSSDEEYTRRAVLTFDTETTLADNASIASAKLVLTVKTGSNSEQRTLSACSVPISFDEPAVTWKRRKTSNYWSNAGGDIATGTCSTATVTGVSGSKVTFDVSTQIRTVLKGTYGSRYARFLVGDTGGSSRGSYKAYHSNNSSTTSSQPTLIVTLGTPSTPSTTPDPAPETSTSSTTLRVLQWNIHHGGYGTDGRYDPNRVATWMAKFKPDVILINEIEKFTGWGNQNQPEVYKSLLQSKTGKTWYYIFAQEFGDWSSNGKGNAIFSTVPFKFTDRYELVHNSDRSIAEGIISWGGRNITLISTHLDPDSRTLRLTQATEVTTWASKEPENRIIAGDMNAWPDQTSIAQYNKYYYDSWTVAKSKGTATAFSGNDGETKNGRIDYIFYSRSNTSLAVKSSQVYDTRDSNGVMPSDHRPVLTTFTIR